MSLMNVTKGAPRPLTLLRAAQEMWLPPVRRVWGGKKEEQRAVITAQGCGFGVCRVEEDTGIVLGDRNE